MDKHEFHRRVAQKTSEYILLDNTELAKKEDVVRGVSARAALVATIVMGISWVLRFPYKFLRFVAVILTLPLVVIDHFMNRMLEGYMDKREDQMVEYVAIRTTIKMLKEDSPEVRLVRMLAQARDEACKTHEMKAEEMNAQD